MKRYAALLLAVPVLTACGTSTPASASPDPSSAPVTRCGPAGVRTLAASSIARVYLAQGVAYGCALGAGKSYRLGGRGSCLVAPRVDPVVLAGSVAAYGLDTCATDTRSSQVLVRNLAGGKLLVSDAAISGRVPPESFGAVGSIVIKRDGAVAWVAGIGSIGLPREHFEVVRVDRRGRVLLDSGTRIARGSLRLRGSALTWTVAGRTRSATLR